MTDIVTTLHPEGAPEDNLYPNVKDENIPERIVRKDLLWRNSAPSATGQFSVTVDYSSYSFLTIEFAESTSNLTVCNVDLVSAKIDKLHRLILETTTEIRLRIMTLTSTGITFGGGYQSAFNGALEQADNVCIPLEIYGIK